MPFWLSTSPVSFFQMRALCYIKFMHWIVLTDCGRIVTKYMSHQIYGHKLSHLSFNRARLNSDQFSTPGHLTESWAMKRRSHNSAAVCISPAMLRLVLWSVVACCGRVVLRECPIKSLRKPLSRLLPQGMRTGACQEVTRCAGKCHWYEAGATIEKKRARRNAAVYEEMGSQQCHYDLCCRTSPGVAVMSCAVVTYSAAMAPTAMPTKLCGLGFNTADAAMSSTCTIGK